MQRLTLAVFLVVALLLPACDKWDEGSFTVHFVWSDGAPAFDAPVYISARVEERPDGPTVPGRTLGTAEPVVYEPGVTRLAFGDIANGSNRVVIAEVREVVSLSSQVLYYGISDAFTLAAGKNTTVDVFMELVAVPSAGAADDAGSGSVVVVTANGITSVNTPLVDLELTSDTGILARISNLISFPDDRTESYTLADLDSEVLSDGQTRYSLTGWDLDAGLTSCETGEVCSRQVFVRFVDAQGYESATCSAEMALDLRPPSIVQAATSVTPPAANGTAIVTVFLVADEQLATPPEPTVNGVSAFTRVYPESATDPGSTFIYTATASTEDLWNDGLDYEVRATLVDLPGNEAVNLFVGSFDVDSTSPTLTVAATITPEVALGEIVIIDFKVSEMLAGLEEDPPILPTVRLGGVALTTGVQDESDPLHFTFTHEAVLEDGNGYKLVSVELLDEAANLSSIEAGSVLFDVLAPTVASVSLSRTPRYAPAEMGSVLLVSSRDPFTHEPVVVDLFVYADEPLGSASLAVSGPGSLSQTSTSLSGTLAHFIYEMGDSDVAGNYSFTITWADMMGNTSTHPLVDVEVVLQTSLPALTIEQSQLSFLRSPWGNAVSEEVAGRVIAAGISFELAPLDSLSAETTLPANTFTINGSEEPAYMRIWSDEAQSYLMATLSASTDGTWPRTRLSGVNTVYLWATAVDAAGNESLPEPITHGEWVVTANAGPFSPNPHLLRSTAWAPVTREPESRFTTPIVSEDAAGTDGQALIATGTLGWREVVSDTSIPPVRSAGAMAWDSIRGRAVLFGGDLGHDPGADTWEWDGTRWEEKTPVDGNPEQRDQHAMAFDAARGVVVLFGGRSDSWDPLADTWEWDGTKWEEVTPAFSPPGRMHHTLTYDAARGVAVLFGGDDDLGPYLADTWTWDGREWLNVTPDGDSPIGRHEHAAVYDVANERVVLFGGLDWSWDALGDTWQWNGSEWLDISPSPLGDPVGMYNHSMAYDIARDRVVMWSGHYDFTDGESIWEWVNNGWLNVIPSGIHPSDRYDHNMIYDNRAERVVLFGGMDTADYYDPDEVNDTWEWDGVMWVERMAASVFKEWYGDSWKTRTSTLGQPVARIWHGMVYDEYRGASYLYGGYENGTNLSDLWRYNGSTWTQLAPAYDIEPPGRRQHAMAYDTERRRIIVFSGGEGSTSSAGVHHDLWEHASDGGRWYDRTKANNVPFARYDHALAFDDEADQLALYGGNEPTFWLGSEEHWVFDGAIWQKEDTGTTNPGQRRKHAMAYDSNRGRLVLFGGFSGNTYMQDVWEHSSSQGWVNMAPAGTLPISRHSPAMAFDAKNNLTLMFGGNLSTGALAQDMWTWNGSVWSQKYPIGAKPVVRYGHGMVWDAANQVAVMHGGVGSTTFGDTWLWNGSAWVDATPTGDSPGRRRFHTMAYDALHGTVVLFGGMDETHVVRQDTWLWNGSAWQEATPVSGSPPGRIYGAMAYDSTRERVVLHGGQSDGLSLEDVWEWDGSSWHEVIVQRAQPLPRKDAAATFDSIRNRFIIFGGRIAYGTQTADTWEWDGSDWYDLTPPEGQPNPTARYDAVMGFDPDRGVAVLFGGAGGTGTWEWNGSAWTQITPATSSPPYGDWEAMVYNPHRQRMMIYGGMYSSTLRYDVWEWDGKDWYDATTLTHVPVERDDHAFVYDVGRERLVVFGGWDQDNIYLSDTWELDMRSARLPELTLGFTLAEGAIDPLWVKGMQIRAHCGATFAPFTETDRGAALVVWSSSGPGSRAGEWKVLATNDMAILAEQPYLPVPTEEPLNAALLDWSSSSVAQALQKIAIRDGTVTLGCRPAGTSGIEPGEARVALDYIEARIRYEVLSSE